MISFYNNQFTENTEFANRSFRYGDGLFETVRMQKGEFLFFNEHLERMFAGLAVLGITLSREQDMNYFYNLLCELVDRNNFSSSARIRLQVSRTGGGTYLPESDNASVFAEVKPLEENEYIWDDKGLSIGFSKKVKKSYDVLSNVKTCSALPYVIAAMEAKEKGFDEMLVPNAYEKIADATTSNVFLISKGHIITPSLRDGGVAGVFRHHLINMLKHFNYPVTEQSLGKEDILKADEVFLTNVIKGIRPVRSCDEMQFKVEVTKEIFNLFNKQLAETDVAE